MTQDAVLANNVDEDSAYEGAIDEVRLYARALTSYEATNLYESYTVTDAYNAWFDSHVGISVPRASRTGWDEDYDGDGISNLLEYVLIGDPTAMDLTILPEVEFDELADEVVFQFQRRTESIDDIAQTFNYSSDLNIWDSVELTAGSNKSYD